jgi:hypothetical protein
LSDEELDALIHDEDFNYFKITDEYKDDVEAYSACLSQLTGWDDQTTPPESIAFVEAAKPYL